MPQVFTDEFIAKCRRFVEARQKRDRAKAAAKEAEDDYRELEAEVHDMLTPEDPLAKATAVKVPLGEPWGTVTFQPRATDYARIIDDEKAVEWAEGRALIDEFTAPKFVMARLNEEVREARDEGKPLPDGVDFYTKRFVTITIPKT